MDGAASVAPMVERSPRARRIPGGAAVLALASTLPALAFTVVDRSTIDDLGWLAGCWAMEAGETVVEEQWMAPAGGMMLGMSRTVRDGRTVAFEHLRIREEGDLLVYRAEPSGQAPAEFTELESTERSITFANPAHDYPQRIRYTGSPDGGTLTARIEATVDGEVRGSDFPYTRRQCVG